MTCCICGEQSATRLAEKEERKIVACARCKTVRTLDPPEGYIDLYTNGDSYHGAESRGRLTNASVAGRMGYRERFDHDLSVAEKRWSRYFISHGLALNWMNVMKSWPRGFSVLDFGCANGAFLAHAKRMGANAVGMEINSGMASWAEGKTGCKVHTDMAKVDGKFDLVVMLDVIEHLEKPVDTVIALKERLNDRGIIVIDTPDVGCCNGHLDEWRHLKPLEHLWFFDEKSLRMIASKVGMRMVGIDRPITGKIVAYIK